MNEETSSDDVIVEEATDDVIVNQEEQVEETTETPPVSEEETPVERDDYYKNRSYELERKLENLTTELPTIIEQAVTKKETNTQKYSEKDIPPGGS